MVKTPKMPMSEIQERVRKSGLRRTMFGVLVGLPSNPVRDQAAMKKAGLSDSAIGLLLELAEVVEVVVSDWSKLDEPDIDFEIDVDRRTAQSQVYRVHAKVAVRHRATVISAMTAITGLTRRIRFEDDAASCHIVLAVPEFADECVVNANQVGVVSSLPLDDQGSLVSAIEAQLKEATEFAAERGLKF